MQAFRVAAERAIALNPMDGFTMAYLGFLIAYSGDWERGCAVSEQARSLNPHHPGWYWFAPFFDAYRKHEYGKALEIAPRIHMPASGAPRLRWARFMDKSANRKRRGGLSRSCWS
jgi:hypothetical protein